MSDLVERLRGCSRKTFDIGFAAEARTYDEAADAIEELQTLLSCAQTYVKLVAESGNSPVAEELFFGIKEALAKIGGEA